MSTTSDRQKRIERMQRIRAKVVEWAAESHPHLLEAGVRCWLGHTQPSKDKVKEAFLFALVAPLNAQPSLLEQYAASGQSLSRFERDMFAIWSQVHFSVFTVNDVEEGVHLVLTDRVSQKTRTIRERTASKSLQRGDTFAAFLKPIGDAYELEGTIAVLKEHIVSVALHAMGPEINSAAQQTMDVYAPQSRARAQQVIQAIRESESLDASSGS